MFPQFLGPPLLKGDSLNVNRGLLSQGHFLKRDGRLLSKNIEKNEVKITGNVWHLLLKTCIV